MVINPTSDIIRQPTQIFYPSEEAQLDGLRCPTTHQPLRFLRSDEIEAINTKIAIKKIYYRSGALVVNPLSNGVLSQDGQSVYRYEHGIFVLLERQALMIGDGNVPLGDLRKEKKQAQNFYEQLGWQKTEEDVFYDAAQFEDLRSVSEDYRRKCHLRINRFLEGGKYLLDVASGPIQYPEYLSYSDKFDLRICVDISFAALLEARKKIGTRGIFLQADVTKLPFDSNSIDGIVSLHTLYHVPEDEQKIALDEIFRVLKSQKTAVVVYSWGSHSLGMNLTFLPIRTVEKIRRFLTLPVRAIRKVQRFISPPVTLPQPATSNPGLYFYSHSYSWFQSEIRNIPWKLYSWRSVSVDFMRKYIPENFLGKVWLRWLYQAEEKFPDFLGRLGQYPMFVVRKS